MRKRNILAPLAMALPLSLAAVAPAQADTWTFQAQLTELNGSGASGSAWVIVEGDQATVKINGSGFVAGAPHAQHIHIGGRNECPTMAADDNGDGVVSTVEGKPAYGSIKVSLTTKGDYSPQSALAVKRMPVASESGELSYTRTLDLSSDVVNSLSDGAGVVVVHGIDTIKNDGKYSGKAESALNPKLPLEATAPAACGELSLAPQGGMQTGNGGAAGDGLNTGLIGLGGAFVLAASGGVYVALRRRGQSA